MVNQISAGSARRIITPAAFQPAPFIAPADTARAGPPRRAIAWLLLLTVLALGLLMLLPRWSTSLPRAQPPLETATEQSEVQTAAEAESDDEQRSATARRNAQILLRAALARVTQLEALQVERWDRGGLHHLQEQLAQGEKAYSEQRFHAAQDAYRDALVRAARVELKLPSVIAAFLQQGETALRDGNSAAAEAAFAQVLAIAPANKQASEGRARAATLDRVHALVEQAQAYEQRGDEAQARVVYNDAARLDARMESVQAGLARLDAAARTRRLGTALSEGHVALERSDYKAARAAFQRAAALDAKAEEVIAGLRETDRRAAAAGIAAALESASLAVRREAWSDAARAYGAALALDGELGVAVDGKRETEQRAQFDAQLEQLRGDVLALADGPRREIATRTLKQAQSIPSPGTRLRGQMAALTSALRAAREPLKVTLVSDGESDISIEGVGAIGRFAEQQVTLTPGRHSALIRHAAQPDVHVEFVVTPGASASRVVLNRTP